MDTIMLEILTPEKALYWGRAESVTVGAIDGELQVLPGHIPYVNVLKPGDIRMHTEDNTCLHFKHNGGIIEVSREKTSVLVYPEIKNA